MTNEDEDSTWLLDQLVLFTNCSQWTSPCIRITNLFETILGIIVATEHFQRIRKLSVAQEQILRANMCQFCNVMMTLLRGDDDDNQDTTIAIPVPVPAQTSIGSIQQLTHLVNSPLCLVVPVVGELVGLWLQEISAVVQRTDFPSNTMIVSSAWIQSEQVEHQSLMCQPPLQRSLGFWKALEIVISNVTEPIPSTSNYPTPSMHVMKSTMNHLGIQCHSHPIGSDVDKLIAMEPIVGTHDEGNNDDDDSFLARDDINSEMKSSNVCNWMEIISNKLGFQHDRSVVVDHWSSSNSFSIESITSFATISNLFLQVLKSDFDFNRGKWIIGDSGAGQGFASRLENKLASANKLLMDISIASSRTESNSFGYYQSARSEKQTLNEECLGAGSFASHSFANKQLISTICITIDRLRDAYKQLKRSFTSTRTSMDHTSLTSEGNERISNIVTSRVAKIEHLHHEVSYMLLVFLFERLVEATAKSACLAIQYGKQFIHQFAENNDKENENRVLDVVREAARFFRLF